MPKKLNDLSGMPRMQAAFSGWKKSVSLVKVTDSIDADGFNAPIETVFNFRGSVQPMSAEQLQLKDQGLRSFPWLMVHVQVNDTRPIYKELNTKDIVLYLGKRYVVKEKLDYSINNYIEYHIMEAAQNG